MILEESLKLLNEGQALSNLYKLYDEIDEMIVEPYEKKLESSRKEEEKALENEEYNDVKTIKQTQIEIVNKLINAYKKKIDYLEQINNENQSEAGHLMNKGVGYFSDKDIKEFKNDSFKAGEKIKIVTPSSETVVQKVSDINSYKVIRTNIEGVMADDLLKLSDLRLGHNGTAGVYRNIAGRVTHLKDVILQTIKELVKHPTK
jgi:hypothetical protein